MDTEQYAELEANGYRMFNDIIFSPPPYVRVYITRNGVQVCEYREECKSDLYSDMQLLLDFARSQVIESAWQHYQAIDSTED